MAEIIYLWVKQNKNHFLSIGFPCQSENSLEDPCFGLDKLGSKRAHSQLQNFLPLSLIFHIQEIELTARLGTHHFLQYIVVDFILLKLRLDFIFVQVVLVVEQNEVRV